MITKIELEQGAVAAGYEARRAVIERLRAPQSRYEAMSGWTCPDCGESPQFREGDFRVPDEWLPCQCQRDAYEAARQAYLDEHWSEAVEGQWAICRIPPRYLRAGFRSFDSRPGTDEPVKVCRTYAEQFQPGVTCQGLILIGGVGAGKTHLVIAVARRIVERTLARVFFTTSMGLLAEVKAGFGQDDRGPKRGFSARTRLISDEPESEDLIDLAKKAELLILDDLGQEQGTEFDRATLFSIINHRYEQMLPTIITSNQGDATLRACLGPSGVSRLYEMCRMVRVDATDYRQENLAG